MKAIIITQQLKDLNPNFGMVGTIRKGNLPKSFFSLNYNKGRRTDGYHTLDNSTHELDGFYNIVTPTITKHQRLVNLHFDTDRFTYDIEDFTADEITTNDRQIKSDKITMLESEGVDVGYEEYTFHFSREMASQFLGVAQLSEKLQQPTMEWKNDEDNFIEIPIDDAYLIAAQALGKFKQIHLDNV